MIIFSIETSCDETACALVKDGIVELASVVASSKDFHESTGGIVPEIAARKQIEFIVPVIAETMKKYDGTKDTIDAIAVTVGPGLIGSLLVGVEAAKALSLAWNKPLVPVNHLIGHIYGNFVNNANDIKFPALVLIVSGGHTDIIFMRDHGDYDFVGGTLDDAAGEAFDKTARLLGLAKYLGGVQLSKLSASCTVNKASGLLPRPMLDKPGFDMSFSGLKTSVKRLIDSNTVDNASIACEFETALIDVLENKIEKAITKYKPVSLLLGGGVSANTALKTRLYALADAHSINFSSPPLNLCTDNAVYIASAAYFNYLPRRYEDIVANPSLTIMDSV